MLQIEGTIEHNKEIFIETAGKNDILSVYSHILLIAPIFRRLISVIIGTN
jgi:hypothetical protein